MFCCPFHRTNGHLAKTWHCSLGLQLYSCCSSSISYTSTWCAALVYLINPIKPCQPYHCSLLSLDMHPSSDGRCGTEWRAANCWLLPSFPWHHSITYRSEWMSEWVRYLSVLLDYKLGNSVLAHFQSITSIICFCITHKCLINTVYQVTDWILKVLKVCKKESVLFRKHL